MLDGERFPRQVSDRILRGVGSGVEAELTSRQAQSDRSLPARNRNCEAIAVLNKRNPAALISLLHPASVAITAHGYHAPCELIVAALGRMGRRLRRTLPSLPCIARGITHIGAVAIGDDALRLDARADSSKNSIGHLAWEPLPAKHVKQAEPIRGGR